MIYYNMPTCDYEVETTIMNIGSQYKRGGADKSILL